MICLLDTNVLSQRMAKVPDLRVIRFLEELPQEQAFLSVVTMLEVRAGTENPKTGPKRRDALKQWLAVALPTEYVGRILPVTLEIADEGGRLLASEKSSAVRRTFQICWLPRPRGPMAWRWPRSIESTLRRLGWS